MRPRARCCGNSWAVPGTVGAGEARLVGVGHEVIVETVLPGEGGLAYPALKRPQSGMAPARTMELTLLLN
jgi:hypothetical protein